MSTNAELYPTQFHHYLSRNLRYVLGLVQQAGPVLGDEVRVQALHTLSYALQAPTVWPLTRDLFLTLAPKMEQAGQRDHWIPYLQTALRQSEAQGDSAAAGECHFQLALLYRLLSHFAAAHEHLQAALAHFTALAAQRDQARVLNELAWLEHLQYHHANAAGYVEQALTLLGNDDPERAMAYRVQGMLAIGYERWQEAEELHRRALALFEQQGDLRKIAWSKQNLGYALRGQERYSEAIDLFQRASVILETIGDQYHWTIVQNNLGLAYYYAGAPNQALTCYTAAKVIAQRFNDKLQFARLGTNFGLAFLAISKYEKAKQCFRESANLHNELGNKSLSLNALDGLAMVYLAQKQYTNAIVLIEETLTLLPQIADAPNYHYLLNSLHQHLRQAREEQVE
ncbi:MAG: tetratricopeptide repeat protein [Caldilinea sp. CFX5]|nr:tetratricopeptide repeat protein [Caldilinea sp. CFX5]